MKFSFTYKTKNEKRMYRVENVVKSSKVATFSIINDDDVKRREIEGIFNFPHLWNLPHRSAQRARVVKLQKLRENNFNKLLIPSILRM